MENCPRPAPSSVCFAVPAFSLERLRRLLHSPGNAPLAHSCFGLTPQGEAFRELLLFAEPPIYLPDNTHHFHIYENGEMM